MVPVSRIALIVAAMYGSWALRTKRLAAAAEEKNVGRTTCSLKPSKNRSSVVSIWGVGGGVGSVDTDVEVADGDVAFSRARWSFIISWYAMSAKRQRLSNSCGGGASLGSRLVFVRARGWNL